MSGPILILVPARGGAGAYRARTSGSSEGSRWSAGCNHRLTNVAAALGLARLEQPGSLLAGGG